jgi:hypothetical protein
MVRSCLSEWILGAYTSNSKNDVMLVQFNSKCMRSSDSFSKNMTTVHIKIIKIHYVASIFPEDECSNVLRNTDILPQHYTASKPRRLRLESSPPWKPQNLALPKAGSTVTSKCSILISEAQLVRVCGVAKSSRVIASLTAGCLPAFVT